MRGALAAGEAQAAMRLAAAAGWYWWLGGHRTEGIELITAATDTARRGGRRDPGHGVRARRDVRDLRAGPRRAPGGGVDPPGATGSASAVRYRHPLLGFVAPLERMLQEPDAIPARVRAAARPTRTPGYARWPGCSLGKMRIMLGHDGRDADADLETALAEFRALGERLGISFALTELADRHRHARRVRRARASTTKQAIAVVTEVGADRGRHPDAGAAGSAVLAARR